MPLSGLLSAYGFAGGWPSIFYVFGLIGTIWSLAFLFLVHEDPENCPRIKDSEKKYILSSLWGAAGSSVSILVRKLSHQSNQSHGLEIAPIYDFNFIILSIHVKTIGLSLQKM